MPVLSLEVDYAGKPLIELYVTMGTHQAQDRRAAGLPVPGALAVAALLDTGASRSVLALSVVAQLGLIAMGETDLFTASTGDVPVALGVFAVDLALAGDRTGPIAVDLEVAGSDALGGVQVQMLLGRDVLDRCLLAYDGPNRRFALAYDLPVVSPGA